MIPEFKNEAPTDFTNQSNFELMLEAIKNAKSDFGREYEMVIAGKRFKSSNKFASCNPSNSKQVVGYAFSANPELAEQAMVSALNAFEVWKNVSPTIRARYLFKAAALMRKRKAELTAAIILENGKNWAEADGDVAEAIDFLDFYATMALQLAERQPLTRVYRENNELYYIPLGVGVIISPWNFPLAILTGMTCGPLVMGNTVILKPASNTPVVAYKLMEIMEQAGEPEGVINLVYGNGSTIGNYLVRHPKTRFINFTGSKEVGLFIVEEGSRIQPGQKCSASSRGIIDEKVYDYVERRLVDKAKSIKIGPAENYDNYMGPLIDQNTLDKVLKYINIGKQEGELLCGGNKLQLDGYYVEPTIFSKIDPKARIAQEEIFGPVLALIKAKNFDEALNIANNTDYGLTGSVYSNNWAKLEKAQRDFYVGNLYFNRKSTQALVGVHPFGGYNMSGTGSKAGGRDYLLLFSQGKSVSEEL